MLTLNTSALTFLYKLYYNSDGYAGWRGIFLSPASFSKPWRLNSQRYSFESLSFKGVGEDLDRSYLTNRG
ncbi:MAG: hypothetical protein ACOC57_04890 [Acidobacteriota bacterium]